MLDMLRSARFRLGRWPRLAVAGVCLLLAVASALGAGRGPRHPAATVPVLVTARPLPAGCVLAATDVRIERWPAGLPAPPTPASVDAVVGRRCAGALVAGEPVTAARVLGAGIATGLAPGLRAVPLAVPAAAVALVRAGDRVDVLAGPAGSDGGALSDGGTASEGGGTASGGGEAGPAGAHVVAAGALVLAVVPGTDDSAASVVVAADAPTALRAARLSSGGVFGVSVLPP